MSVRDITGGKVGLDEGMRYHRELAAGAAAENDHGYCANAPSRRRFSAPLCCAHVASGRHAEQAAILPRELRDAFVADLMGRGRDGHPIGQHRVTRLDQAKLLLKL